MLSNKRASWCRGVGADSGQKDMAQSVPRKKHKKRLQSQICLSMLESSKYRQGFFFTAGLLRAFNMTIGIFTSQKVDKIFQIDLTTKHFFQRFFYWDWCSASHPLGNAG